MYFDNLNQTITPPKLLMPVTPPKQLKKQPLIITYTLPPLLFPQTKLKRLNTKLFPLPPPQRPQPIPRMFLHQCLHIPLSPSPLLHPQLPLPFPLPSSSIIIDRSTLPPSLSRRRNITRFTRRRRRTGTLRCPRRHTSNRGRRPRRRSRSSPNEWRGPREARKFCRAGTAGVECHSVSAGCCGSCSAGIGSGGGVGVG